MPIFNDWTKQPPARLPALCFGAGVDRVDQVVQTRVAFRPGYEDRRRGLSDGKNAGDRIASLIMQIADELRTNGIRACRAAWLRVAPGGKAIEYRRGPDR